MPAKAELMKKNKVNALNILDVIFRFILAPLARKIECLIALSWTYAGAENRLKDAKVQKQIKFFLLLGVLLPIFTWSDSEVSLISPDELVEIIEEGRSLGAKKLESLLHVGYCYSVYSNEKKDHIHNEDGTVTLVDPSTIPDESVITESSLLWINAEEGMDHAKAVASFGDLKISDLSHTDEMIDALDEKVAFMNMGANTFKYNKPTSTWVFINSRGHIDYVGNSMVMWDELIDVSRDENLDLVAKKIKLFTPLDGGEQFLREVGFCHYPVKVRF